MPFTNQIAGGQGALVRNWLQSQNFVAGVSGWQIRKDGNVEFNNGTFRGSLTSGTNPGKHIVLNNPITGDAVDVYDSSNNIIYSIDANGNATSTFQPGNQASSVMSSGFISFFHGSASAREFVQTNSTVFPARGAFGALEMYVNGGDNGLPQFSVLGNTGSIFTSTVVADERGVFGSVVVSDNLSVNNLMHSAFYSGTVGAGGAWAIPHGCAFTPNSVAMTSYDIGGTGEAYSFGTWNTPAITATICNTFWRHSTTQAALAVGTQVAVYATFFG